MDVLFLRVNSIEPLVGVCCAEDPVNCVPPCVSSIYPSSVSFSTPPPQSSQSEVSAFINRRTTKTSLDAAAASQRLCSISSETHAAEFSLNGWV